MIEFDNYTKTLKWRCSKNNGFIVYYVFNNYFIKFILSLFIDYFRRFILTFLFEVNCKNLMNRITNKNIPAYSLLHLLIILYLALSWINYRIITFHYVLFIIIYGFITLFLFLTSSLWFIYFGLLFFVWLFAKLTAIITTSCY